MITFQKTTSVQKPQPGAVKEKVLERKRSFLFDLFAVDIIAILKYAAPDGSMSWVVVCWCDQWTSAAVSQWHKRHRNDMTLNSKTTSVKKRLEAQVVLPLGHCGFGGTANFQQTYRSSTEEKVDRAHFLSETWQKYVEKPMPCLRLHVSVKGAVVRTPPPPQTAEKAPPKRSRGYFQMATGPPGGNISGICSMVNQPNLAKWSMKIALEVGNEMKSTWFHFWQLRCRHLSSFNPWY